MKIPCLPGPHSVHAQVVSLMDFLSLFGPCDCIWGVEVLSVHCGLILGTVDQCEPSSSRGNREKSGLLLVTIRWGAAVRQSQRGRAWPMVTVLTSCHCAHLSYLFHTSQDHLLGCGPPHNGLRPPTSISNQKNAPQTPCKPSSGCGVQGEFLQLKSPPSAWL